MRRPGRAPARRSSGRPSAPASRTASGSARGRRRSCKEEEIGGRGSARWSSSSCDWPLGDGGGCLSSHLSGANCPWEAMQWTLGWTNSMRKCSRGTRKTLCWGTSGEHHHHHQQQNSSRPGEQRADRGASHGTATHQEEAGALGAQLDLGVGRQGEERHPVLLVNGHGPAQEATGARTHTHRGDEKLL